MSSVPTRFMSCFKNGVPLQARHAVLMMIVGEGLLTGADTLAKITLDGLLPTELLLLRSGVILLILLPIILWGDTPVRAFFKHLRLQLLRAVVGTVAVLLFFESLIYLPLSIAVAIGLLSPIFINVLSIVLLGEQPSKLHWVAAVIAFAGAMIMAKPSINAPVAFYGLAVGIMSSLSFALSWLIVRRIGNQVHSLTFPIFLNLGGVAAGLTGVTSHLAPIATDRIAPILGMAALVLAGQLLVARAFTIAPAHTIAPLKYTDLVWALFFQAVFWIPTTDPITLLGAVLVIVAGIASTFRHI